MLTKIFAVLLCSHAAVMAYKTILLTPDNHVSLIGEVNQQSVGNFLIEIGRKNHTKNGEIYIVLNSPGGQVGAGNNLVEHIRFLQAENVTVNCLALNAASMAFAILQACDNRLVTTTSLLMQHQISNDGIDGSFESIRSYVDFMMQLEDYMTIFQAERLNMTEHNFREKTEHDWWLLGTNAVTENVADQVVTVGCHTSLYANTKNVTVTTMFGPVDLVYSTCPAVTGYLAVHFNNILWVLRDEAIKAVNDQFWISGRPTNN